MKEIVAIRPKIYNYLIDHLTRKQRKHNIALSDEK